MAGGMGARIGRAKVRELLGRHKDILVSEGVTSVMQRQSLTISHQQSNGPPVSEQQPPWQDNPLLLPLLPVLLLSTALGGMGCPFGQSSLCPLSTSCLPPACSQGDRVGNGEGLDRAQAVFSNSQNTGALSSLF